MSEEKPPVIRETETAILKKPASQGDLLDRLNFWKLAIFKCFILCILASVASLQASFNGIEAISAMSGTQLTGVALALIAANAGVILAFLSDTMQKLSARAEEEKKKVEPTT